MAKKKESGSNSGDRKTGVGAFGMELPNRPISKPKVTKPKEGGGKK